MLDIVRLKIERKQILRDVRVYFGARFDEPRQNCGLRVPSLDAMCPHALFPLALDGPRGDWGEMTPEFPRPLGNLALRPKPQTFRTAGILTKVPLGNFDDAVPGENVDTIAHPAIRNRWLDSERSHGPL
jgi:hypothetical protein